MTHFPQNSKERRRNISLTGDGALLLEELHLKIQAQNKPVNVSLTDVVCIALAKLKLDLENN